MGKVFKIESMGLFDGPGIRTVVFLSGCSLRCKYCHNPESWDFSRGEEISPKELIRKIVKFKPFYDRSGGGVTFSGGEPLMQPEFLEEMLRLCKEEGIHTCIDTAGAGNGNEEEYKRILSLTDLVLFDVKATNKEEYFSLCDGDISRAEKFIKVLNEQNTKVIIRQVLVPGLNDSEEHIKKLKNYVEQKFTNVEKIELLPYHKMAEGKYKQLGLTSPFESVPAMDKKKTECLQKQLEEMTRRG